MYQNGSITQKVWAAIKSASNFLLYAHAEEGNSGGNNPPSDPPKPAPDFNLEQLLSKVRQEEKDKLYGQIKELKSENSVLRANLNDALMQAGKAKSDLEALQGSNVSADDVKKLEAKIEALETENKKLKDSAPNEEDLRKKIEAEYELKDYAKQKVEEANKDKKQILSVYAKDISGKTKEEIDAAVKKAIEQSAEILKEVGVSSDDGGKKKNKKDKKDDSSGNTDPNPPSNDDSGSDNPPAPNPSMTINGKEYTADYVRSLKPGSKEYEEFRTKVLGFAPVR